MEDEGLKKKKHGSMEIDPTKKTQPSGNTPDGDKKTHTAFLTDKPVTEARESNPPVYHDVPEFQDLLRHFQNAEWEECLKNINQLLGKYPGDEFLSMFKQDVEIRLKQQQISTEQQIVEKQEQRRKWLSRSIVILGISLVALLFLLWAGNLTRKALTQSRVNQEATLTAQTLAAKYQTANNFMRAGKPQDALRLYNEIEQTDPTYPEIEQRIQEATQAVEIENWYQEGVLALNNGQSDQALELFLKVDELHPKYKDTPQLIDQIRQEKQIAALVVEIHDSYAAGDWLAVISAHEAIQTISPMIEIKEVSAELFISYRNFIMDIADSTDATLEDIERAEKYYRNALAIFPDNKEYAYDRDELRKVIPDLLAHKYYLFGISLLESSDYSIKDLPEALRILTKAGNIGTSSPVVSQEIEKAQLFLDSYNHFMKREWDETILGLEKLFRFDENYAAGRMKYLIYEAHIAHGDILFKYADFAGASTDYQEAEKMAWSNQGNLLRLFQVEVRIAATLNRLGQENQAVEFYHYAFDRLDFRNRLTSPEKRDLLNLLVEADKAYENGRAWEAIQLYQAILEQKEDLYEYTTISVKQGDALADIAYRHGCTIESLTAVNNLGEGMIFVKDQEILIPVIPTDGQ